MVEPTAVFSAMQNSSVPSWGSISTPLLQSSLDKEQKEGNKILTKNSHILEKEGMPFDIVLLGNPSEKKFKFFKKEKSRFYCCRKSGKMDAV